MPMSCAQCPPLVPPKVVAIAKDRYLKPTTAFPDGPNLPGVAAPMYGQDITFGVGRAAPKKQSVGTTPNDLKVKMRKLLTEFASGDKSGMAKRLFDVFLEDVSRPVMYFDDRSLSTAASRHSNIAHFMNAALSAPNSVQKSAGKTRIHQALKAANWDIKKLIVPTDLGVPAFNLGATTLKTGDYNNGLGLMINGIQHAYILATHYFYDSSAKKYCITLRYIFYDVFGLDDDDLEEFGAPTDSSSSLYTAPVGITAWWQLQHQHGYAPLVTRIVLDKAHEAPAT